MAKRRLKIGIVFSYNPTWTGGTYYILNLINALGSLPEDEMPQVVVFYGQVSDLNHIKGLNYPFLEARPLFYPFLLRGLNKVSQKLFSRNVINYRYPCAVADVVYPYSDVPMLYNIPNKVYWIPDLQEKFYPEFFSSEVIGQRDAFYRYLVTTGAQIVFSSHTARKHFRQFYPVEEKRLHVLHFSSVVPPAASGQPDFAQLRHKYGLRPDYIICPNALALNKNHLAVLQAARLLKERGVRFQIVFTGKEFEGKMPEYPQQVKKFAADHHLDDCVKFLGFIDRDEQLVLIRQALLLLQPSLFEGWNTGVEEAKALGKYIVASDIEVHREQLEANCAFFDPRSPQMLADVLEKSLQEGITETPIDYRQAVTGTAHTLCNIFRKIVDTK